LFKGQVEGGQHGNSVTCFDFAGISDLAHGLVNFVDGGQQARFIRPQGSPANSFDP